MQHKESSVSHLKVNIQREVIHTIRVHREQQIKAGANAAVQSKHRAILLFFSCHFYILNLMIFSITLLHTGT